MSDEDKFHIILCQPHFMAFPGFPDYAPPFLAADIFDLFGGLAFSLASQNAKDCIFRRPEEKLQ